MLDKSIRDIERERQGLQAQEKKLIAEIKKSAKQGQMVCLSSASFLIILPVIQLASLLVSTLLSRLDSEIPIRYSTLCLGTILSVSGSSYSSLVVLTAHWILQGLGMLGWVIVQVKYLVFV